MSGYEDLRDLGVTFRPISQVADRAMGDQTQTVAVSVLELSALHARVGQLEGAVSMAGRVLAASPHDYETVAGVAESLRSLTSETEAHDG